MMAASVLFPAGVRASTWLMAGAFVLVAARQRNWLPIVAGAAWVATWEAVFQILSIPFGVTPFGVGAPVLFVAVGCVTGVLAVSMGVRPSWPLLAAAGLVIAIWAATGFHVNQHTATVIDPTAEALNELAKTLWGLAFLLPLVRWDGWVVRLDAGRVVRDRVT